MTPDERAAIEARDVEADRCKRCGEGKGFQHNETSDQCEARMRSETKGERGCWAPEGHHPYEPGGFAWGGQDAAEDRTALLIALSEAEAALLQMATEAGEDTSDITDPRQLVHPPIGEYALGAVRQLRADYDELLSVSP